MWNTHDRPVTTPRGAEGRRQPRQLVVTGAERLQGRPEVGVLRQELAAVGLSAILDRPDVDASITSHGSNLSLDYSPPVGLRKDGKMANVPGKMKFSGPQPA
jgi:hypothetical protein